MLSTRRALHPGTVADRLGLKQLPRSARAEAARAGDGGRSSILTVSAFYVPQFDQGR